MKHLVEQAGLSNQFEIASAATSTEEIGNPVYPPAKRKLAEHGISCEGKRAHVMTVTISNIMITSWPWTTRTYKV